MISAFREKVNNRPFKGHALAQGTHVSPALAFPAHFLDLTKLLDTELCSITPRQRFGSSKRMMFPQ